MRVHLSLSYFHAEQIKFLQMKNAKKILKQ